MRNIFIGDIHGCYDEFILLIEKLNVNKNDKVFIVGDMINRGPKSVEVIKYLFEHQDNFFPIKGNHEVGFLKYIKGEKPEFENAEYIKLKDFLNKHPNILKFLQSIPLHIESEKFRVVHAGIIPGIPIEKQKEQILTEIYFYKELPWYFSYPSNEKLIIYGHWSEDGVHIRKNTIGLDTGCCLGRKLTAYILEEDKLVQIKAKKNYYSTEDKGYDGELVKKGIYT